MLVEAVVFRRSPILGVVRLVSLMTLVALIEALIIAVTDNLRLSDEIALFQMIEFDLASFLLVSVINVTLTFGFLLRWATEVFEVRGTEIIHRSGILRRKEERFSLRNVENLTLEQGALGQLLRYGTVRFFNPLLKSEIRLTHMSDAAITLETIRAASSGMRETQVVPLPRRT